MYRPCPQGRAVSNAEQLIEDDLIDLLYSQAGGSYSDCCQQRYPKRCKQYDTYGNIRCFPLNLSDVYTSGIRTIDGLNAIGEALYPELYQE